MILYWVGNSFLNVVVSCISYEFLFVLQNLEKAGLIRKRESIWIDSASPFATLRKQLNLIKADVDAVEPDDVSYVSSGYAPISVRLIQAAMQGWAGKEDVLRELPGRYVDIVQRYPPDDFASAVKRSSGVHLGILANQLAAGGGERKPVLLVYFVGGVTFMEIAALRFLSKRPSFPYNIVCCCTSIINGSSFLQSLT